MVGGKSVRREVGKGERREGKRRRKKKEENENGLAIEFDPSGVEFVVGEVDE
jgi:hypothetical protein